MKKMSVALFILIVVVTAMPAIAAKAEGRHEKMADQRGDLFLERQEIDGYVVSFHVMRASPAMDHGGTHNFMVKVEKDGTVLRNVLVNSKKIGPGGSAEIRRLVRMGDWSMNGYDLGGEKTYQLLIRFRTEDGVVHEGGIHYRDRIAGPTGAE